MATHTRKPELPRRVSLALLGALIAASTPGGALAQYQPSGYERRQGEPFFLLTDKSYGSQESAEVRLEVASSDAGLSEVQAYGGVDVVLYRVPQPLTFLKQQKNLHRVQIEGRAAEEGVANTLAHVWDRWYQASRRAWRRVFSANARKEVTQAAPELRTAPAINAPTTFQQAPQFKPLPGFELIDRFRYPVHEAQPIQPPKGVALAGSSSEFISPRAGNVMIPLGRQKPGLYLVEAYVGGYHASTLLFVSDTIAITKASSGELVVWTAQRASGAVVPKAALAWTDGIGVLASGQTDAQGLARFTHPTPERSYLLGEDPSGGVFISENFYYDSEIYDTKLYAVTDRPLYRPGDQVFVKIFGREFQAGGKSLPAAAAAIALTAYDPGGAPIANQHLQLASTTGGDTSFRLPENAVAGGYELRFTYKDALYSAAFRVAEYQKPHFDITLVPDKADFKVGDAVAGRLQLHYTDGKPVKNAEIELTVRSQQLTMVDGELGYYGQFPVKIEAEKVTSDAHGEARFSLPPVSEPSRYLVTVFATDGAAYRVKTTKELLIERGQSAYTLRAERQFSAPSEKVAFSIQPVGQPASKPATWQWLRLEDRRTASGALSAETRLELAFAESGSYTIQLRDAAGDVVAAASHWVSGAGLHAPEGNIEIVPSKPKYAMGETAELLITFPSPVEQALLTLERDRVERATPLTAARGWVEVKRLAPTQWRARVPIAAAFAPNIIFSVVYVKDGEYVFQNQGLAVAQPQIEIAFRPEKQVYAPGERVNVGVTTTLSGKAVPAAVAVGVVDEMIYALQPEIAPDIYDFFYHPRRNNVRTAASQSFISYDLAMARSKRSGEPGSIRERRVKVLERPRRDEVDTAFWQPLLQTDKSGRARFSFVMPDALTRWRITGRAINADGIVGQRTASVRSEKDFYVKWTSPTWMRAGDSPVASIAAFNQTGRERTALLKVSGLGLERGETVALRPGVNFIAQSLAVVRRDGVISVSLASDGRVVDALDTQLARVPAGWPSPRTVVLSPSAARSPLDLPADARNVRVTFASSAAAQYGRVIDDLLDYPYGCIEQTASRMIPFALALEALPPEARQADWLRQQLNGQRLRLAYMAGPKATFTWWGALTTEDPFLTAYAYYADWSAVRALHIELPEEHWKRLLDTYSTGGASLPFPQRALMLSFMQEMGLPVKGLVDGLLADLQKSLPKRAAASPGRIAMEDSVLLGLPDSELANAFSLGLAERLARRSQRELPPDIARAAKAADGALRACADPAAKALLMANGHLAATDAEQVLGSVRAEMPTLERALALVWIHESLRAPLGSAAPSAEPEAPWQPVTSASGAVTWRWPAATPAPKELRLKQAPSAGTAAIVQFESAAKEDETLPAKVTRRFYRLTKAHEGGYSAEPVAAEGPFSTGELYLDEITVAPEGGDLRYVVLEAPLPPGASVESTTWGVELRGRDGKLVGLERARHEPTRFGYAVPLDPIAQPVRVQHLLRFAQNGAFTLPRTRLYRMYQPTAKAFESASAPIRITVR